MSAILGTNVSKGIAPHDTEDTYETHDEQYGKGGYRTVATFAARDAIPTERMALGMQVKVQEADAKGVSGRIYQLESLSPVAWTPLGTDAELKDRALQTGRMPLDGVAGFKKSDSIGHDLPGIGEMVLALVDALNNLGFGVAKDGTAVARNLNALAMLAAPLLSMPIGGSITIAGDGGISGATGADLQLKKTDYDWSICDPDDHVLCGYRDGTLYLPGQAIAQGVNRTTTRTANDVLTDAGEHSHDFSIVDSEGNPLFAVEGNRFFGIKSVSTWARGRLDIELFNGVRADLGDHNYDFCICDGSGNVLLGWLDGAFYAATGYVSTLDLDAEDQANKAYTASVYQRRITTVQKPIASLNALYMYGQSLGQGDETWPALSRDPIGGVLSLGGNTLGSTEWDTFTQFSPTGLQPLVAMTVYGSTTWPDETVTQASGGARGEPVNIGWARGAKHWLTDYLLSDLGDTSRSVVTINVSKSGATIGELTKGHTEGDTEYYGKYTGSLSQLVTAAGSNTLCIAGIMYMQGEHDYIEVSGKDSQNRTYASWKAKIVQLAADMQADALATAPDQSKPPAFLIYQTGAAYTRDVDGEGTPGMHVGMAQLDFSLESDTAWMVGPVYPYTDKGGHLDSNGSRWYGHTISKVWERIVVEGHDWEPLRPIKIWQDVPGSNVIYVGYHVPFAPLVFDEPQLSGGTEYSNASKGFRCTDDTGSFSVTNAEIVRDTIVKLTCSRDVGANARVWYASQGTTGNGMVRDSDPTLASDLYVYEPDRGMLATANIAQFVDQPYPLWNWSVGFVLPVGYPE